MLKPVKKNSTPKPLIGQIITISQNGCYGGETSKFKRRTKNEPRATGKTRERNPRHHIRAGFCRSLPNWEGDVYLDSLVCQVRKMECLSLRGMRIKRSMYLNHGTWYSYAGIHLIKSGGRLQRAMYTKIQLCPNWLHGPGLVFPLCT